MRHSIRVFFLALGLGTMNATPAGASVGGPTIVDILGWDSATNRVYFTVTKQDEGDWIPLAYYVALGDTSLEIQPAALWKDESHPLRPEFRSEVEARVLEFRRGLNWLGAAYADTTEVLVRVAKSDSATIRPDHSPIPRYLLDVTLRQDDFISRFEATAYCRTGGRVVNWQMTPDPDIHLAVFSFVGDPMETCYETQQVVVLRRR